MTSFSDLFKTATGHDPNPYQEGFTTREEEPSLVPIATGCGKTAAVPLSWLWQRRFAAAEVRQATARRIV